MASGRLPAFGKTTPTRGSSGMRSWAPSQAKNGLDRRTAPNSTRVTTQLEPVPRAILKRSVYLAGGDDVQPARVKDGRGQCRRRQEPPTAFGALRHVL
jgi:hypothetical protein